MIRLWQTKYFFHFFTLAACILSFTGVLHGPRAHKHYDQSRNSRRMWWSHVPGKACALGHNPRYVLCVFEKDNFLTIRRFFRCWSLTLFSWPLHVIKGWYCMEKSESRRLFDFKELILSHKLQCYSGISSPEKSCNNTRAKNIVFFFLHVLI